MTGPTRVPHTFSLPPLVLPPLLAAAALLVAACSGDTSGDNNQNNVNVDSDAGLDSAVDAGEPDAWVYQCPSSQPEGHFCLRGQVRHMVDDSPVTLPPGATVQRLIPTEGGNRPTQLQAEAQVQPDGRFIFPSVEKHIRQDVSDGICNDMADDCMPYRYDHFDLIITTDASGYHVPRNRYGVAVDENPHQANDPSDYIFGLYLIANETYDAWAAYWPGDYLYPPPDPCCPLDSFSFDDVRVVVPVCYQYFRQPPPSLFPDNVNFRIWQSAVSGHMCFVGFESDRLTYPGMCGSWPDGYTNVGLMLYDPTLDPTLKYGVRCDGWGHPSRPDPSAFATFDSADGFADGHIVVVHGLADYYERN